LSYGIGGPHGGGIPLTDCYDGVEGGGHSNRGDPNRVGEREAHGAKKREVLGTGPRVGCLGT